MKSKIFTLFSLAVFSLILFVSLTSAAITYEGVSGDSQNAHPADILTVSFSLVEDNTNNFTGMFFNTPITLTSGTNTFTSAATVSGAVTTLAQGVTSDEMTLTLTVPALQAEGTYTGTLTLNATDDTSAVQQTNLAITIVVEEFEFCDTGSIDDTDLTLNVDISNRGEGEDDEWLPLDTIEIEVEIENAKSTDLEDVIFELGLFKQGSSKNIASKMMWISSDDEKVDISDVDEDEDGSHVFEFRIDPDEIDEDSSYILAVKAYPDNDEDVTCIDYSADLEEFGDSEFYAEITIDQENDKDKMIVVDEESMTFPIRASCNQNVMFSADVYNIGDRTFDDQVKVDLFNSELGIDVEEILTGDMDAGDKRQVTFSFNIPKDAEEKQYTLYMRTYYDYDKDDETYDKVSDDTFPVYLKVEGNCVASESASVSATLESEAIAGEELVVKAIITNTASKEVTYMLNAAGYTTWATTVDFSESQFTLAAGESKEVLVTFLVDSMVSGEQVFDLEVLSEEGLLVYNQPISVLIQKSGFSITGGAIGSNPVMWSAGLLVLILILVIIILAVKVSKR